MSHPANNILNPDGWIDQYGDYLYSIAKLKLRDPELAEDLVQETFLSAFKAKNNFKGDSSEKTWLTTILNNKIIDEYRKKARLNNTIQYISETEEAFTNHFFKHGEQVIPHWLEETAPADWGGAADKKINQQEFYTILDHCIKKIPDRLAVIFIAKFVDEIETEHICKEFEISSSNYWVIIHRAKVLIRSCLEKNWFIK
jgi:RNA polymerase sigma-70 factor (TIGR02943 family)